MKPSHTRTVIFFFAISSISYAASIQIGVNLESEFSPDAIPQVGDILTVPVTLESQSSFGVCGVEVALTCPDNTFRINSVTFHEAFGLSLEETPALPATEYHAKRLQRMSKLNKTLGTQGNPITVATVELEVISELPPDAALDVEVRAIGISRSKMPSRIVPASQLTDTTAAETEATPLRGMAMMAVEEEPSESDSRAEQIKIHDSTTATVSLMSQEAAVAAEFGEEFRAFLGNWTNQTGTVSLDLYLVGGTHAVSTVEPNTRYEVRYEASVGNIDSFVLSAVSISANQGITLAEPPTSGDWMMAGSFSSDSMIDMGVPLEAPDHGTGWSVTHIVSNDYPLATPLAAGSTGTLCIITTGPEGPLTLDLYMEVIDLEAKTTTTMKTSHQWPMGNEAR